MKNALTILSLLFIPLFFSCSNSGDSKFVGAWKNKQHDSIEVRIKKDGDNYFVSTFANKKLSSTLTYKLQGSSLVTISPNLGLFTDISYVASSDNLSWDGLSWERVSN
jgi:hypothetical protein